LFNQLADELDRRKYEFEHQNYPAVSQVGPALAAISLCRVQQEHTMSEKEVQIGNSGTDKASEKDDLMFYRRNLSVLLSIAVIGIVCLFQTRGRSLAQNVAKQTGTQPSLDFFDATDSLLRIPIKPFAFTRDEIPFDFDPRPEMFDPVKTGQEADAIDLGLRNLVRNRASDAELRRAVDKLVRWAQKMERLQSQYYAGGLAALDMLADRNPRESKVLARCATRWVDAVEVERMEELATVTPAWRGESNNMADVRVDPQTYLWRYPPATPNKTGGAVRSAAFPKAQKALQRALSVDAHNPEALFASAMLSRRTYGVGDDVVLSALRQASQSTGAYASAAHLYVLERDRSYTSGLTAQIDKLREVIRGPSTGGGGRTESFVGSYTPGQSVDPGEVVRGSSVYRVGVGGSSVPGPILKAPTAQELAQADALEVQLKQFYIQNRQQIDDLVRREPTNAEMFVVLGNNYHGGTIGERVLRYALLLNPGDYRLYWLRLTALAKGGHWIDGKEQLGPHNIGEASEYVQLSLHRGKLNDVGHCRGLDNEIADKYDDPFTVYTIATHCMHLEPDRPAPRRELTQSIMGMSRVNFLGTQFPDAFEQGQLESEVMYQIAARLLDHKEEWRPGDTEKTFVDWMALAKFLRGGYMRSLHRDQEARQYYLQSIKLDPDATPAQKVLNQMSNH
jgi:tetratricopeptide (TPR) repeat protein